MKKTIKPVDKAQIDLFAPKPQSKKKIKLPPNRSSNRPVTNEVTTTEIETPVVEKEKLLTPKEELELKEQTYLDRFIGKYKDEPYEDD